MGQALVRDGDVGRQVLFEGGTGAWSPVSVATRHAEIGIFHHTAAAPAGVFAWAPAQGAQVVILQMGEQPAHDLWADGRHRTVPYSTVGDLGILDLEAENTVRLRRPVDTLLLHVPEAALRDIAEDAEAKRGGRFSLAGGWTSGDAVMEGLRPLLFGLLQAPVGAMRLYADHLLLAAAGHLATTYGGMRHREPRRRGGLAAWQQRRAKEMIAQDLAGELSLAGIAEACGLSVSHFARAFKVSEGTTPHGFLTGRRLERAREMLAGEAGLAEIASACGFADQSHFTRIFRRATGATPGAWRRQHRDG